MSGFIGTKLTMNLGERSYDIILKSGALENLYQFARLDRRVAVVTDAGVPAEYAQRVADQCRDAKIITVPQGEASKSMKILESVLRQMLEFNMGRGDLVIAVGGGVVGDLAGFAASIYMRGIDFINCPHHHPLDDRFLYRRQDRCGVWGRRRTSSAPSGSPGWSS